MRNLLTGVVISWALFDRDIDVYVGLFRTFDEEKADASPNVFVSYFKPGLSLVRPPKPCTPIIVSDIDFEVFGRGKFYWYGDAMEPDPPQLARVNPASWCNPEPPAVA